jgi:exoribonuclease-2
MNVLFEEDGAFRAGSVLADSVTSLQIELASGKRSKVKAANVLLRFTAPSPGELLERAEAEAEGIDIDFLWEVCGEPEFGFEELAAEYHGAKPDPVQSAAVLLRLHSAPIYFHRKGRGRFRKAPPEILQAALAGLEKKRQQAAAIERMVGELKAGQPARRVHPHPAATDLQARPQSAAKPRRWKPPAARPAKSAARLLLRLRRTALVPRLHLGRFLFEYFPDGKGGTGFPTVAAKSGRTRRSAAGRRARLLHRRRHHHRDRRCLLGHAPSRGGGWRIGIHIAAPGLGFGPDSGLDGIARNRLSTVYMPGNKITMLPEEVVERFTLGEGRDCPALSLYLDVSRDFIVTGNQSRIERVPVVANLRHHDIEPVFNETTLAEGGPDFPWKRRADPAVGTRHRAGSRPRQARGQPEPGGLQLQRRLERPTADGPGRIDIGRRPRGSPLDKLVAELMIAANSTWGKALRRRRHPGLYRAQGRQGAHDHGRRAPTKGLASIATPGPARRCAATWIW